MKPRTRLRSIGLNTAVTCIACIPRCRPFNPSIFLQIATESITNSFFDFILFVSFLQQSIKTGSNIVPILNNPLSMHLGVYFQ